MNGLFGGYAIIGIIVLVGYVLISLILGLLLGKLIGKIWMILPFTLLMLGLFYFLDLDQLAYIIIALSVFITIYYLVKNFKK